MLQAIAQNIKALELLSIQSIDVTDHELVLFMRKNSATSEYLRMKDLSTIALAIEDFDCNVSYDDIRGTCTITPK